MENGPQITVTGITWYINFTLGNLGRVEYGLPLGGTIHIPAHIQNHPGWPPSQGYLFHRFCVEYNPITSSSIPQTSFSTKTT